MTGDEMTARCPYCQGDALTRLVESDARWTYFGVPAAARSSTSIVSADEPPEELSMPTDD
jgi:hypothetical protein